MRPNKDLRTKGRTILLAAFLFFSYPLIAQNMTPTAITDQNMISIDGAASSASLYNGSGSYGIPIYTVRCGSLSLPISLSYSYDGLKLGETVSWVGLGWDLQAGGTINRVVQGGVDSTRNSGRNYGEYSIADSIFGTRSAIYLNNVYADAHDTSFDSAPDIYDCSFSGYAVKFYWFKGRAFMLSYNKGLSISKSGTSFVITTQDGTIYTFAVGTGSTLYAITQFHQVYYTSSWNLSSIVSADHKDTISISYSGYTAKSYYSNYSDYYPQGTYPFAPEFPSDTVSQDFGISIIQNITCRNSRVSFIPDASLRTDELVKISNGPKLREIDVIDSINQKVIKKNLLSYEYFNLTATNPTYYERLKLKTFSNVNPTALADSQTYRFNYINEYNSFPKKFDLSIDDWGYYDGVLEGLIVKDHHYLRVPNVTYCSYGALDTVFVPTGGLTTYSYELNDYDSGATQHKAPGPGIRVKTIAEYLPGSNVPAASKTFSYLADDGSSSSGSLNHFTSTLGPVGVVDAYDLNNYVTTNNNPGSPIKNNIFFYNKVSAISVVGKEKHRSDYYYKSFSNAVQDIVPVKQVSYRYDSTGSVFYPQSVTSSSYDSTTDSVFLSVRPYIDSSYVFTYDPNTLRFAYAYAYDYNPTYWLRLTDQRSVVYDNLNDSAVVTTHFNYNTVRNLDSSRQTLADGTAIITKTKYADDYSASITGGLINHHVLGVIIENQGWLQHPGSAPAMVSGSISSYDTSIFRVKATYALEPTVPLTSLNNETLTSGKYNTLLSDNSNYVLKAQLYYDANNNLDHLNRSNDITSSFIYDYRHSLPVATISNASGTSVAFTSFEADNDGNWTISDTSRYRLNSMTGKQSCGISTGKSISASFPSGTQYIVSYWTTAGAVTVTANGSPVSVSLTGLTKNGWTYREHLIPATATNVSLTSSTINFIDELRLYPVNAQMSTVAYDPLIGEISECTPNNMISYYDYDGFNRLKDVKDMDRNIVKLYDYQYNQSYTYSNTVQSGGFIKNDCACGYTGSGTVTYTVSANTYTSHGGSQWDADQLARNDISANGQAYANAHGSCVAISCSGVDKRIVHCTTCETGTKIYTSSVWSPSYHEYLCTYHYEWSDGYTSGDYTEYDKTSCVLN